MLRLKYLLIVLLLFIGACGGDSPSTVAADGSAVLSRNRTFTLQVNKSGTGSGTVTSSPSGINCGATCSKSFSKGTVVTLTATPAAGSVFAGWSGGGTSGTGNATVTLDANVTVTATFNTSGGGGTFTLTVNKTGSGTGTVTSNPAGIDCGSTCSQSFSSGTTITLTATPAAGSVFAGWSGGGTSGTGTATINLTANTTVTATFNTSGGGGGTFTVSVTKSLSGLGNGIVSSSPAGIDCGSTCTASFPAGTSLTLFASPTAGEFTGWSAGPCAGSNSQTCTFILNANTSVTAAFATQPLGFIDATLGDGNVGAEYTQYINTNGGFGSPDMFDIVAGSLPDGLVMDDFFGVQSTVIHGKPTQVQTSNFTVRVTDQSGSATRAFSIRINAAVPLIITVPGPTATSGTVGTAYRQNLFGDGGKTPYSWSITGGALPPGLKIVSASNGNRIEGTPTTRGTFTFTLTVKDSGSPRQTTSQQTTITIN